VFPNVGKAKKKKPKEEDGEEEEKEEADGGEAEEELREGRGTMSSLLCFPILERQRKRNPKRMMGKKKRWKGLKEERQRKNREKEGEQCRL
jgi:hypothetical protein